MRTLLIVTVILALAVAAGAEDPIYVWFYGPGDVDMVMQSPPVCDGAMDAGGMITAGSWQITIPDDTWPDTSDPEARFTYIWDTFFAPNYVPGTPGYWIGYLDMAHGLPEQNDLYIVDDTFDGTMTGYCTIQMLVSDYDNDGELDADEFCDGSMSGCIIIIQQCTGCYDGYAGTGSYSGTFVRNCPDYDMSWDCNMYIWLEYAGSPVEESSWGGIKALYR